jgi:hypothetical protein
MIKKMFVAVACLGAAMGYSSAQTLDAMRVKLPMDAKVGNVTLPAGEYAIKELNNSVLEFKSQAHNGVSAFVSVFTITTADGEASSHSKVVLKKSGGNYQVQSIWIEGQDLGFELTSAAE